MAELSGAHCALCSPRLSAGGEKVSWRALSVLAEEAGTIQRWFEAPSAVACVRVKSTSLPSGERIGEERAFRCRRSSLAGKCGAVGVIEEEPDCAGGGDEPGAKGIRGRVSLKRSMGSAYNGGAELALLAGQPS